MKSCRDCAYRQSSYSGVVTIGNREKRFHTTTQFHPYECNVNDSPIYEKDLDTKSCKKFLRKKEGMTLEQQINALWINRIKRNYQFIVTVIVSVIAIIVTVLVAFYFR
jgi:hypothetical protein